MQYTTIPVTAFVLFCVARCGLTCEFIRLLPLGHLSHEIRLRLTLHVQNIESQVFNLPV